MTAVYLAGKIAKNDWRHDLVPGLRNALDVEASVGWGYGTAETPWGTMTDALGPGLDYVGPFFLSCDHGCYHAGEGAHGNGEEGCGDSPSRATVLKRCVEGIARADVVFAWLDDPTAYGTVFELGYAAALAKRIIVATPRVYPAGDDQWLAIEAAEHVTRTASAVDGWAAAATYLERGRFSYQPDDIVTHSRWGIGTVVSSSGSGDREEVIVSFPSLGEKHLLVRWAPLAPYRPGANVHPFRRR